MGKKEKLSLMNQLLAHSNKSELSQNKLLSFEKGFSRNDLTTAKFVFMATAIHLIGKLLKIIS